MKTLLEIVFVGLLRGWPGKRCPDCGVRPGRAHSPGCPGRAYGLVWG